MNYIQVVTPPASEPITLSEAKLHLRVEITDDDSLITTLISAARIKAESLLGMTLMPTVFDAYFDDFPGLANGYFNRIIRAQGPGPNWLPNGSGVIELKNPPIISVDSVKYYNSSGTLTTYPAQNYFLSLGLGTRIQPLVGQVWPVTRPQIAGIIVRYTAGYADASSVPANVKQAMLLMIGHWYEHREEASEVRLQMLPMGVHALLSATDPGIYS